MAKKILLILKKKDSNKELSLKNDAVFTLHHFGLWYQ